jgi:heme-degrading monooxygenase HmoA
VPTYYLAQANIGRFRAPIESDVMEGFRNQLDQINALADQSPGFIWRLQTEDGNATAIRPYAGDDLMAINMSVWESLESLQTFVYKTPHVETLRARKQWFEHLEGPILVLWWVPAGHIPSVSEAQERLAYLKEHGPTPRAFTFRPPFSAPNDMADERDGLDAAFFEWATPDSPPASA